MNALQRRFTKDISRVQEVERRLAVIETHLSARNVPFARRVPATSSVLVDRPEAREDALGS